MTKQTVQMNVRVSKKTKDFAIANAKNQFQSLSKYIEKLLYEEQKRIKSKEEG